jgi:hypothetical protein
MIKIINFTEWEKHAGMLVAQFIIIKKGSRNVIRKISPCTVTTINLLDF